MGVHEEDYTLRIKSIMPKLLSEEELHKAFFDFAADNSEWINESFDLKENTKDEAVVCLSQICGAVQYIKHYLLGKKEEDDEA